MGYRGIVVRNLSRYVSSCRQLLSLGLTSLSRNITILICAPATPDILADFHSNNSLDATLIVTAWNLGATLGSLLMGPLSEIYGRFPVYNLANLLFLVFRIAESKSQTIGMIIAFRFLNGLTVASSILNPGIVADLFVTGQRGRAQSLISLMRLLGPILGPIIGGYLAQARGWRWMSLFATITIGVMSSAFLAIYRETYHSTILRRKAQCLRKKTNNVLLHSCLDHRTSAGGNPSKGACSPSQGFLLTDLSYSNDFCLANLWLRLPCVDNPH